MPGRHHIDVFVHVATMNHWREVVNEIWNTICVSGLHKETSSITFGVAGMMDGPFPIHDQKVNVVAHGADPCLYEFPTLQLLWESAQGGGGQLLYLHSKGVSYGPHQPTEDWRRFMLWSVVEQYKSCLEALNGYDTCGPNWLDSRKIYAGNFWWADAKYIRMLADPCSLNVNNRHLAESWIGSGPSIRPACLHRSPDDGYRYTYPRWRYARQDPIPTGGDSPYHDKKVALIFDSHIRRDTTGAYCYRALRQIAHVDYFQPTSVDRIDNKYDLYLSIDNGLDYQIPAHLRPLGLWAIDTHLTPRRILHRAGEVEYVFAAQKEGASLLQRHLSRPVEWLPLACDPQVHAPQDQATTHDIGFVGHIHNEIRHRYIELIRRHWPNHLIERVFFRKMARAMASCRIAFNKSLNNDLNMRVYEAMASGAMLLTDGLHKNGQGELFKDRKHIVEYTSIDEFLELAQYYLENDEDRERIANEGRNLVIERHTYLHRMRRILDAVSETPSCSPATKPPPTTVRSHPLTSIVVLTCNQLSYTKLCLDSLRTHTDVPYELIVVDNGSTDGTIDYLRCQHDVCLIENDTNRGYAAGCNQGIRQARGEQIMLLNNDVVVTEGWLARLTKALWSSSNIGMTGPCTNYTGNLQRIEVPYNSLNEMHAFAEHRRNHARGSAVPVEVLYGFCLLIKRSLIDRIGLLDEQFEVGMFEDTDLCRRSRKAGYRLVVVEDVFVHHFGSQTFRGEGLDMDAIYDKNQRRYCEKWDGMMGSSPNANHNDRAAMSNDSQDMPRLSMCMIARDNERTLSDALKSIKPWVDEMVVVDTGSTDRTRDIARDHGASVHEFLWCDDFAAARNESLRHATGDWVLWMDSDDTISQVDGRKLRDLMQSPDLRSKTAYVAQVRCGSHQETGLTVVDHVKIIRNIPGICFEGRIHEQVLPSIRRLGGEVGWTDIVIDHSGADYSPEGQARKLERDLRILNKDLENRPGHPFVLFNLGMTHANAGEPTRATEFLTKCIEMSSTSESHLRKAYSLLVSTLNAMDRPTDAQRRCWEGLGRYPDDPELLFLSGTLAQRFDQLVEAEEAYTRILQRNRTRHFSSLDPGIVGHKCRQNLAVVLERMGRWEEAESYWRAIHADMPGYLDGWRGLVDNLLHQNKVQAVESLLAESDKTLIQGSAFAITRAQLAANNGEHGEAKAILHAAIKQIPDDIEAHHALCKLLFEAEDEGAEDALHCLAELDPSNGSVEHNLGLISLRREDYGEALKHFDRSIELRPLSAPTHYYKGIAYQNLGQLEHAQESWNEAIRIDPQYRDPRVAIDHSMSANTVQPSD